MKRPNTTTVLLATIAVLLGLNLLARPRAEAQPQPYLQVPPRVTGLTVVGQTAVRVWSDGVAEWRGIHAGFPKGGDDPFWIAGSEWTELLPQQP